MNLNRLAYFTAVVDAGSFTGAAERLGVTKTVVSDQVRRLEEELRVSLLTRTTRRVEPTEAGRLLHARGVQILKDAEDAFGEIAEGGAEPSRTLRIAAPNDYGTSVIAPLVASFTRRYPSCNAELFLSDSRLDLVATQIDISIRVGRLTDSGLVARKIGGFRQLLVAAASWGDGRPIAQPADLSDHPFIANGALREPLAWQFNRGDFERVAVRMKSALSIDTAPAVLAATLAGGGASVLPDFLVAEDLRAGRLVNLLPEWSLPSGGIFVVYPALRFRPPKVRAFNGMLTERVELERT